MRSATLGQRNGRNGGDAYTANSGPSARGAYVYRLRSCLGCEPCTGGARSQRATARQAPRHNLPASSREISSKARLANELQRDKPQEHTGTSSLPHAGRRLDPYGKAAPRHRGASARRVGHPQRAHLNVACTRWSTLITTGNAIELKLCAGYSISPYAAGQWYWRARVRHTACNYRS
jgi:hypothetical protein